MPRTFEIITGHGRSPFFTHTTSQVSQGSSVDFGQFNTARYSRFAGYIIASSVGVTGLTFRHRFATQSGGPWQMTSATVITSGATAFSGTIIDLVNYGQFAYFDIISVDSTTQYTAHLAGEPMR